MLWLRAMRTHTLLALATALAGLVAVPALTACATTAAAPTPTSVRARDLVPLAIGNQWDYRVSADGGGATSSVKIVDKDAQGFFIDNLGNRLAPRTDGLFDGDRFLVQEPVEEGHQWIAVPKDQPNVVERYRIASVAASVQVPAGTFEGCVEVEAEQVVQQGVMKMTWTFAPGVGLIRISQRVAPTGAVERTTMTMELVKYSLQPAPAG